MSFKKIDRSEFTTLRDLVLESVQNTVLSSVIFSILIFSQAISRIIQIKLVSGGQEVRGDAQIVWIPVARAVLDGTPLYVPPAVDNKPPLWQFLNILFQNTGDYATAGILTIALANTIAVVGTYLWISRHIGREWAFVGGLLLIAMFSIIEASSIGTRSIALVGVLFGALSRSAVVSGMSLSAAVLVSQFSVFAIPIVVFHRWVESEVTLKWFVKYAVSGIATAVVVFGMVFVLWGWPSLVGSIEWTFLGKDPNASGSFFMNGSSLFANPLQWGAGFLQTASKLWFLLVPAFIALSMKQRSMSKWIKTSGGVTTVFTVGLLISIVARPHPYYWILPAPWLVSLSVIGFEWVTSTIRNTTE